MPRTSSIERNTKETKIKLSLDLDKQSESQICTGIGFFDHMLSQVAKHGMINFDLNVDGDIDVDCHHTIEDVGIVFGQAINNALGDKGGITRYGEAFVPMDDALVLCVIDISGRPYLSFEATFSAERIGTFDTEMVEEFFRALSVHSGITIHIKQISGKNNHHIAEAIFKAFGRALRVAINIDSRIDGVLSTKGVL